MKKAILRSWNKDIDYTDSVVEVDDDYDFAQGPYAEANDRRCPVVGSNQEILEVNGEVRKELVVSTAHITKAEAESLVAQYERDYRDGSILCAPEDAPWILLHVESWRDDNSLSAELRSLLLWAVCLDCTWLRLDADGPKLEGHKTYDWE